MKGNFWGLNAILAITAAGAALLASIPAAQATVPTGAHPSPASPARVTSTLDEKSAVWDELHVGDCQQDNGTIVIRSDGTGDWSADTLTYHTVFGDIWHSSFDFYTTAGFHLFGVGTFDSPRMNSGNPPPRYHWGAHFLFNPADFNSIDIFKTMQHYSC
ncbi:DUF6294 family protein [Kutzneria buriramensis]|uniref:DUF6294 domain-containing protein n=1 Tax=Kutzneria buriramensis TaxID=1045776 RepID=A0A3E0HLZ7_9PSEU|nr:DUF6294 family protein [Kutzneria buriramensis]REH47370.1 hypothetical protein BCF44_106535 [Kutzneria buriramensis]